MEQSDHPAQLNVFGAPIQDCCHSPKTGYFRSGSCETDETDHGSHTVCAQITREFLEFSRKSGNDLSGPVPQTGFPGLVPGDKWCLCAARWLDALKAGFAPPIHLGSTHIRALEVIDIKDLMAHAVDLN